MRYLDEYRDGEVAGKYSRLIRKTTTRPWTLMEMCGGQTHTIVKFGIESLLPDEITLVHGPGCPVCVTPLEMIDKALAIASRPGVVFTSFGDMLRVPGSKGDLLAMKAGGSHVKMVYSPLDAVRIARQFPDRSVVFFAVGFETTAPANAMAVWQARRLRSQEFLHTLLARGRPSAIEAILSSPSCGVQGFLAAGHVCTVMGIHEYAPIAARYQVPIVVTGFEPVDILQGVYMASEATGGEGRCEVENQYSRSVRPEGNVPAQKLLGEVFEVTDRKWRGIGNNPRSGYRLREEIPAFDAEKIFDVSGMTAEESARCLAGQVLQGLKKPPECPAFGTACNPDSPARCTNGIFGGSMRGILPLCAVQRTQGVVCE